MALGSRHTVSGFDVVELRISSIRHFRILATPLRARTSSALQEQTRFLVWCSCRRALGQEAADGGAQRRHRGRAVWMAIGRRAGFGARRPGSCSASRSAARDLLGRGKLKWWGVHETCKLMSDRRLLDAF